MFLECDFILETEALLSLIAEHKVWSLLGRSISTAVTFAIEGTSGWKPSHVQEGLSLTPPPWPMLARVRGVPGVCLCCSLRAPCTRCALAIGAFDYQC